MYDLGVGQDFSPDEAMASFLQHLQGQVQFAQAQAQLAQIQLAQQQPAPVERDTLHVDDDGSDYNDVVRALIEEELEVPEAEQSVMTGAAEPATLTVAKVGDMRHDEKHEGLQR
jgi:hypothetical protein